MRRTGNASFTFILFSGARRRRRTIPPEIAARPAEARPWTEQGAGLLRRTLSDGARLLRPGAGAPKAAPPAIAAAPPADAPSADASSADVASARPGPAPFPRFLWSDRLWGEGMRLPGGATEVLRLASLLPLAPEVTLLLAGAAARASGAIVTGARGCFVAAFDADPPRPGQAATRRAKLTAEPFDAGAPAFRPRYHHHALLLEPFRSGGTPDGLLEAAAAALRPGGQVVLLDLVARGAPAGPWEERWLAAEGRVAAPPPEAAVPEALRRAGFDVHVVEDAGQRHRKAAMQGWQGLLAAIADGGARPAAPAAAALVAEAEAWLLRLRLLQEGRLRLLRWHASMPARAG
jgi:hypothetical protein